MPPSIVLGKSYRQSWQQKRAYPNKAIDILCRDAQRLDELTALLLAQEPGIGPLASRRFFADRLLTPMTFRLDRPAVLATAQWVRFRSPKG